MPMPPPISTVAPALVKHKIVARRRDFQLGADTQLFMHKSRTTAAIEIPLHANAVHPRRLLGVQQRILTLQTIGQLQANMRPRLRKRQRPVFKGSKLVNIDVARPIAYSRQAHLQAHGGCCTDWHTVKRNLLTNYRYGKCGSGVKSAMHG